MKINIHPETTPAGVEAFRLTFFLKRSHEKKAKRVREWHATKKIANARREELLGIVAKTGTDGLADELWGKQDVPFGVPARGSFALCATQYLQIKEAAGREGRTISDIKFRLGALVNALGTRKLEHITAADIQLALLNVPGKAQNNQNMFRVWRAFFNWAVRGNLINRSPMRGVEQPSVKRALPVIAPPDNIKALVEAALSDNVSSHGHAASKPGVMLPHVLITFFSGVRPEEACRLSWGIVNFDRGEIVLDEKITKISRVRAVRLDPVLVDILALLKEGKFEIGHFSRRVFRRIVKAAGIKWAADIGRHSYASYLFASGVTEAELVHDMGNSVAVLRKNYINRLATRDDAQKWKEVLPALLEELRAGKQLGRAVRSVKRSKK